MIIPDLEFEETIPENIKIAGGLFPIKDAKTGHSKGLPVKNSQGKTKIPYEITIGTTSSGVLSAVTVAQQNGYFVPHPDGTSNSGSSGRITASSD